MSGNVRDLTNQNRTPEQLLRQLDDLQKRNEPSHSGGGGGDGMDPNERMNSIERAQIQAGMDLAYIKGKLEDMPTKDWMTTRLLWVVGAFVAITGLVQFVIDKIGTPPVP
tara:strand:- start:195 stop:524 length:330 start_codon:yes stop_codon:yes gene_type:complete